MALDALGAHARDELGVSPTTQARPVQAALASACSFAGGGFMPLLLVLFVPASVLIYAVAGGSLAFLALLGAVAVRAGGASMLRGAARVGFWGTLAMAVTAGIGALFGRAGLVALPSIPRQCIPNQRNITGYRPDYDSLSYKMWQARQDAINAGLAKYREIFGSGDPRYVTL